jgi:hypothetical protein
MAGARGAGGLGADLRALFSRWWREAADYQRFVYTVSALLVLAGMFHAGVWVVRGGSWTETISWRKPTLFLFSAGVSVATYALTLSFLKVTRRQGWQLGLCVITPGVVVGALIALQQWRGTRSHFNFFESPFDAAVAGVIAFIISLLVPTLAILAVMSFRSLRPGVPRTLALALRAGLILVNVSFLMGLLTILNGVTNGLLFTIQVPSVIGAAGTTKVAHGLPLHGIQVFIAVAGMLSYTSWGERRQLAVLWMAVTGYAGLVAGFVLQSVAGREPFDFMPFSMLAVPICVALLLAGIGTATTAAIGASRRHVRSEIIPSYPWPPAEPRGLPAPGGVRGLLGLFDRRFWKAAGALVLFLSAVLFVSAAIGFQLPPTLVFTQTAWIDAPPAQVWALVSDHAAEPSWRRELTSVRPIDQREGHAVWQEEYWNHQKIDLATVEQTERPRGWRLVRRMSFHALPVLAGGVRSIDVATAGRGTRITVTEEKVVRVPPFRTWARLFIAPQLSTVTPDRYLAALGARLGKPPQIEGNGHKQ